MSNLDNRISNADQLLTNDIDKFCESVTDFYSNASKPVLDIIIYMYRLTANIGAKVFQKFLSQINSNNYLAHLIIFSFSFLKKIDTFDSLALSIFVWSFTDTFTKTNR